MINKYNDHVLFCYNYDDLYAEVTKRTSKLGQYRRTEALEHLLTQMSMTKDEEFIFLPQIKKACADVYENIYPLSRGIEDAYRWNVNAVTKAYTALPTASSILSATTNMLSVSPAVSVHPANNRTLSVTRTITATNPTWTSYSAQIVTKIWYDVYNSQGIERRYVEITTAMTSGTSVTQTDQYNIFVAENVQGLQLENFVGNLSVTYEFKLIRLSPTSYSKGDYVTYSNQLYKVLQNCDENEDINDTNYFAPLSFDDRNAIIFEIDEKPWLDPNVFVLTDNAIFECLVTFIIADWFETAKADEADFWKSKYESNRADLRHRIQSSGVNHKLKSRYF